MIRKMNIETALCVIIAMASVIGIAEIICYRFGF